MSAEHIAGEILVEVGRVYAHVHVLGADAYGGRVARPVQAHVDVVGAVEGALHDERIELLVVARSVVQQDRVLFANDEFPRSFCDTTSKRSK